MKKKWIILTAAVFLLAGAAAGILFCNAQELLFREALPAVVVQESTAQEVDYGDTYTPLITSGTCYADMDAVYTALKDGKRQFLSGEATMEQFAGALEDAITELGTYGAYYRYQDALCVEIDGVKYGAYTQAGASPIGGGVGYREIFTTGDYVVTTLEELVVALENAKSGEVVYITGGSIDLTAYLESGHMLQLKAGVTLASNRGYQNPDGSVETGARLYSTSDAKTVLQADEGSRISGLVLQGPDPNQHLAHHTRAFSSGRSNARQYYYSNAYVSTDGINVVGDNVRIDNCELTAFGHAAVHAAQQVKTLLVDHCYIHHNQANGLGYGICHNHGSESVIEYCLFNYNRHSIAATGSPVTGYIARYNVEMGESLSHCFDIHGGKDRGDGTDIAGTYCEMYGNTFLTDKNPYSLRGTPEEYQEFYQNVCMYSYISYNYSKFRGVNVKMYDNIFDLEDTQTLVR